MCIRDRRTYVQGGQDPAVPVVLMVQSLMNAINGAMVYMPGETTIHTTAAMALSGGKGVCQDYAHILIALCRMAGIPARYVAGAMVGEGATHAWAEVWLDGVWTGADPTHCRMTDETYIKFSHGRDSVSYTHLDVYKRQLRPLPAVWRRKPFPS